MDTLFKSICWYKKVVLSVTIELNFQMNNAKYSQNNGMGIVHLLSIQILPKFELLHHLTG